MYDIIGFIAAFLTTVSFVPQAVKTLNTKNTEGISLVMYMILTTGVFCWLIYGLGVKDYPIIFANGISFLLSSMILYVKIQNVKKNQEKP